MSKHQGFTLIELLVVVSIISLLIAILLPALSRARESAHAAACGSNMRQVGLGMNMYVNDFDEYFPMYSYGGDGPEWTAALWEQGYVTQVEQLFHCKSDSTAVVWPYNVSFGYNYMNIGTSQRYGNVTAPYLPPARIGGIRKPSQAILITEAFYAKAGSWYGRGGYIVSDFNPATWSPAVRHNDALNVLWVDNHVSRIQVDQRNPYAALSSGSSVGSPSNLWDRD